MKQSKIYRTLLLFLPLTVYAQINFSGDIHPSKMYRTSNQSEISLPFRLAKLNAGYTFGNLDIITNTALEYRWSTGEGEVDLREAYLAWYPDWGEVKLGKQIHAWGAVDGNNPTDNLNPYDYYFMFLPGADRKIGTVSGSIKTYWNDWQLEAVFIPGHEPNRLPFGEEDFPISLPFEPERFEPVEREYEFGFRLQTSVLENDVSVSWFRGNDRSFSLLGVDVFFDGMGGIIGPDQHFGFRTTDVFGVDVVGFVSEFTYRGELAYFKTETHINDSWYIRLPSTAEYAQYVMQVEYSGLWDIQWNGQLIGSSVISVQGLAPNMSNLMSPVELTQDNFQPGMGTPFAMFTDLGAMLSASATLFDNRLEIKANSFIDLKETGVMFGGQVVYSPIENLNVELGISQFTGEEESKLKEMEDFSHINLGVKYSF